jgi:uncharacterized protein YxjI
MKYHIRQRGWTLREEFIVKDQAGKPAFKIKSKLFHIGDSLVIRDLATHAKVARIKQRVFLHLRPHYAIYRNGTRWAKLHEKFFHVGGERFKVQLKNGSIYHIEGDLGNWDFTITTQAGDLVASVGERVSLLRDYYGVDIAQGVDEVFIIALAITLEKIREHEAEKDK